MNSTITTAIGLALANKLEAQERLEDLLISEFGLLGFTHYKAIFAIIENADRVELTARRMVRDKSYSEAIVISATELAGSIERYDGLLSAWQRKHC